MPYSVYPNGIDSSSELPIAVDLVTPVSAEVVNRHRDAIIKIESELGIQPSGTYTTVRARLDALEALVGTGGGLSDILYNDSVVQSDVQSLNFEGAGVTVVSDSFPNRVKVTINGGGTPAEQRQETIEVTSLGQTSFTLSDTPLSGSAVQMFVNGVKQEYGGDYTVSGTTVTYVGGVGLIEADIVEFWYLISGSMVSAPSLSDVMGVGNITSGNLVMGSGSLIKGDASNSNIVTIDDELTITGEFNVYGGTLNELIDGSQLLIENEESLGRTLDILDVNKCITYYGGSDITFTVDKISDTSYPVGCLIYFYQGGTGKISIDPIDGDVTISTAETFSTRKQHSTIMLWHRYDDEWVLTGDLELDV